MSEFLSIGGADQVADAEERIAEAAESFTDKAKELQIRIREVAATKPWSAESPGNDLYKARTQVPPGSHRQFNTITEEELEKAGEDLRHVGETTVSAMGTYEATDVVGGSTIAKSAELA